MSRHNSVTNVLKRFFSREDNKPEAKIESNELNNLIASSESVPKPGSIPKKITDQVIEEVKNYFQKLSKGIKIFSL